MRLIDWITAENLSYGAAARRLGLPNSTVCWRYANNRLIPRAPTMIRIYVVTKGRVTPNDFYEFPKLRTARPLSERKIKPPRQAKSAAYGPRPAEPGALADRRSTHALGGQRHDELSR